MCRRPLLLAFGVCVVVPVVALASLGVWLERWGRVDRARKSDAIIVFGARVRPNGTASPLLRERTRHAFELWKRGLAPKIVCTGGVGVYPPAESIAETELLVKWGVPADDILREEKSKSTRENALFAAELLPRGARVIAVSDPFHVWRCRRECARVGLRASTSAEISGWNASPLKSKLFYCAREAILVVRDTLFSL